MSKLVPLTRGKYTTVSDWRYEEIMYHNWSAWTSDGRRWYAMAKINGKNVTMHRFIMGEPISTF